MKSQFIILSVLLTLSLSMKFDDSFLLFESFQDHIAKFNKIYSTPEEFEMRFQIYRQNHRNLQAQMEENIKRNFVPDFQTGLNEFADLTSEEFSTKFLTLKTAEIDDLKRNSKTIASTLNDLPESFDWREHNGVTGVKNQGTCGSCWAFSTIGNIEGQYLIKHGEEKLFSEQQLVDCDTKEDQGCNGGLMEYAYTYLEGTGLMTQEDYPYQGSQKTCAYDAEKVAVKISGYSFAPKDEEEIKRILVERGPLAIALNATPLQFYFGGIFNPWWDWMCPSSSVNHAVLLVGYGMKGKKPYWIVKNSWGKSWGEKGYFRIIRGKNACGINSYALTADIE